MTKMAARGDTVSVNLKYIPDFVRRPSPSDMRKTIDDENGSTVSFEEVAFRRVPASDDQALVPQQSSEDDVPKPDVLYVLQYLGLAGKIVESKSKPGSSLLVPR